MNNELKNGTELLLSLALTLDLLEQYNAKQVLKKKISNVKNDIEKSIVNHYNKLYSESEEFVQNSLTFKEELIRMVAQYNEADCILAIDFLKKFNDNIELARKRGIIFFDKIL